MSRVKALFGRIFEDVSNKSDSIPRGRKFAKKGPQGAWKALPAEMQQSYINDLNGYFSADEDPKKELSKNTIVYEDGGDIHLIYVEEDGTELESVWDDSSDSWKHEPAPTNPASDSDVEIDGKKQKPPEPHIEPKGHDPEKMTGSAAPSGEYGSRKRPRGTGVTR